MDKSCELQKPSKYFKNHCQDTCLHGQPLPGALCNQFKNLQVHMKMKLWSWSLTEKEFGKFYSTLDCDLTRNTAAPTTCGMITIRRAFAFGILKRWENFPWEDFYWPWYTSGRRGCLKFKLFLNLWRKIDWSEGSKDLCPRKNHCK